MKLNIGCGLDYKEDYINLDCNDFKKDIIYNINKDKIPFQANSAEEILVEETLNYADYDKVIPFILECHRVLEKGGILTIKNVHFSFCQAYGFKNRVFSLQSFRLFTDKELQKYAGINKEPMFEVVYERLYYQRYKKGMKKGAYYYFGIIISYLANLNPHFCERVWCYWFGGFQQFEVRLRKR